MSHVRVTECKEPSSEYKLQYVEVIHRHHKRTYTPRILSQLSHMVGIVTMMVCSITESRKVARRRHMRIGRVIFHHKTRSFQLGSWAVVDFPSSQKKGSMTRGSMGRIYVECI